ncbi:hypothetical protein M0802_010747 [Mischocyttarus mexicanus]|nr:hypothetical protein M0802_010747 [Mischocyttarus mexicanus]
MQYLEKEETRGGLRILPTAMRTGALNPWSKQYAGRTKEKKGGFSKPVNVVVDINVTCSSADEEGLGLTGHTICLVMNIMMDPNRMLQRAFQDIAEGRETWGGG